MAYTPATKSLTPKDIYLEALRRDKEAQANKFTGLGYSPSEIAMYNQAKNPYIGSNAPEVNLAATPASPTNYAETLPISGYVGIQPENNGPTKFPMPTTPTLSVPPAEKPKTTLEQMGETKATANGNIPHKKNPITGVGKGLQAGLNEFLTGLSMGGQNYQELQKYKAMLPYQEEQAQKNRAMMLGFEKDKMALKPTTTINETIDNIQNRINRLTYDQKDAMGTITRQILPGQEATYNKLTQQLDRLLDEASGIVTTGKATEHPQANAEIIATIQTRRKQGGAKGTIESISQDLKAAGEDPANYSEYLK